MPVTGSVEPLFFWQMNVSPQPRQRKANWWNKMSRKMTQDWTVRPWRSSQLRLESSQAGRLRTGMERGYKGLLPSILIWLSSVGNPRLGLRRVWAGPPTIRDTAPQKDGWAGGQIQEGKAVSSALLYPLPFSPNLSSSPVAQPPVSGAQGRHTKGSRYPQVSWRTWWTQSWVYLC